MFHYVLTFLLINTYYQSLGNPIQSNSSTHLLSKSLTVLANQCENPILSKNIKNAIPECSVSAPPYGKKQYQCLIFYDINIQLCSAKLNLHEDNLSIINDKQDVNTFCTLAKDWVLTNISDFATYKETGEKLLKRPATCGEVCGVEELINDDANYYCKYYKWGIDMLKNHVSTAASNANQNAVAAPVVPVSDLNDKPDIAVTAHSNSLQLNTKGQIKQTDLSVVRTTSQKNLDAEHIEDGVAKPDSTIQVTPKQLPSFDGVGPEADKNDDEISVKVDEPTGNLPENEGMVNNDQTNKSNVINPEKSIVSSSVPVPEVPKDLPVADPKETALENPKPKPIGDADDYADSDINENIDDEGEDQPGLDIKPDLDGIRNTFVGKKPIVPAHDMDSSQKVIFPEYFPNAIPDGFSEDSDHFFPFFMTAIILMVLLYILYHNKNKVSKVFFGLILEGRQNGRRRNSRGHAYRRLDTLEQAMSANTAAPPSKIIY